MSKKNLFSLLANANSMRFKLLALVGKDDSRKNKIIEVLQTKGWQIVDVEKELIDLRNELEQEGEITVELITKIKDWFNSKPNKLILLNASILYHDLFLKTSPIGAFKYNSRNKNCILFLEDETLLGNRIYFKNYGSDEYFEKEIKDIIIEKIDNIDDSDNSLKEPIDTYSTDQKTDEKPDDPISNYFNFETIKDVVDIDNDLKDFNRRKNLVNSFIISESLEEQILEFFDDIEKPTHKSRNIIGNYGSGKSHLIGFLVSIIEDNELSAFVRSDKIKERLKDFSRKFYTVQFELQATQAPLRQWFFDKVRIQLRDKYNITIPKFDLKQRYDDKENIIEIMDIIKQNSPETGLLIVIDEVSDFLLSKPKELMRQDLQFLRVIGQITQDEDIMFITSMQEDIFSSPKFQDVADEIARVRERFQNILIHKEDVEKVIAERIVPKNEEQRLKLEQKFSPYMEKIEEVSKNIDKYIDIFPLTPFLIDLFSKLPYFETRGVIQFAMEEVKRYLNRNFPFFLTFENIFNILARDPNRKNLPEIKEIVKTMEILFEKIKLLDTKYHLDAIKLSMGLAVLSLWEDTEKGVLPKELASKLMIIPDKKILSPEDYIKLIVKRIIEVTDGQYIKVHKDKATGMEFIKFDTKAGVDPEEKISQKAEAVSNDEVEEELFNQLKKLLELDILEQIEPNIYPDETFWKSKKSFRNGILLVQKQHNTFDKIPDNYDYAVVLISPLYKGDIKKFHNIQLNIKIVLKSTEAINLLKEIVAIKQLINLGFEKRIMERKLSERIAGANIGGTFVQGITHRLTKIFFNYSECDINGESFKIPRIISREDDSILGIFEQVKSQKFDEYFNKKYPLHPVYSEKLTSVNIFASLNTFWRELAAGNFNNLSLRTKNFLKSLDMLDVNDYPILGKSKICQYILDIIQKNSDKVTNIDDILENLKKSEFGLEPAITYFLLSIMTLLGKTVLKLKGGTIDLENIFEKLKNLEAFESIKYIQIQKEESLDVAVNILKTFGLNGEEILYEKTKTEVFKNYKEKISSLLEKIKKINEQFSSLKSEPKVYIDIDGLANEIEEINSIVWDDFDIPNYQHFHRLGKYSDKISTLRKYLKKIDDIFNALQNYDKIKFQIDYINHALDIIKESEILKINIEKVKKLSEIKENIENICKDIEKFIETRSRVNINGQFEMFKKIYITEIYFPAHEKYVGKDVNWQILEDIFTTDTYRAISQIVKISKQINDSKFKQLRLKAEELKSIKCRNKSLLDNLKINPRCQQCFFPKNINYSKKIVEINNIEKEFEQLLEEYKNVLLASIREYRDNIKYLDSNKEKEFINKILENRKFPSKILSNEEITAINKLFKEIDLITINKKELIEKIFPNDEIISVDKLKNNFEKTLYEIIGAKDESIVRIKLEDINED